MSEKTRGEKQGGLRARLAEGKEEGEKEWADVRGASENEEKNKRKKEEGERGKK